MDLEVLMKNGIGVIYPLKEALEYGAEKLKELGVNCVQIQCWTPSLMTEENAKKVKKDMDDAGIRISSFWAGWTGPKFWNVVEGPQTLGLVPAAYRAMRLQEVMLGAEFAAMLGAKNVATHVGFIPETPACEEYRGTIAALRYLVKHCEKLDVCFNFETGQETPHTLMRAIMDLESDHVGINLDPANLIIYGKGNPVDALDLFRGYVRGVHVKDAVYVKENFYRLGCEQVVGEGQVNFPVFLPKLLDQGYEGDFYIEREISGDQQITDIKNTIEFIKPYLR